MNLEEHYSKLYKESIRKISSNDYEIDDLIDVDSDKRFGITLLIEPPLQVKNEIQNFLKELRNLEPNQYCYPNSDIHITILSIISCYNGFNLNKINLPDYVNVIKKCLPSVLNTEINFKGITASTSCVMVQGFMNNTVIDDIRDSLRIEFKESGLEHTIDERYTIKTAHSTVFRFKKTLDKKDDFLKLIEKYRDYDFGSFSIDNFELVYNDWYQRANHVKKLHKFGVINA